MALSGFAISVQRGLSAAGEAVARTLSGAGRGPLSAQASGAGYERLVDEAGATGGDDAGQLLPVSYRAGTTEGRTAARSRLGPDHHYQQQLQHQQLQSALHPGSFFLPGVSALPSSSSFHGGRLSSPQTTALPATSAFASPGVQQHVLHQQHQQHFQAGGVMRPVPGAAALQASHGVPADDHNDSSTLPRPAGLARIRTRPPHHDDSGKGHAQPAQWVHNGLYQQEAAALSAAAAAELEGQQPGLRNTGSAGVTPATAEGRDGGGSSSSSSSQRWRTREDYRADLAASSNPIFVQPSQRPRERVPSAPGLNRHNLQRSRGQAGAFVQTPTSSDATNRCGCRAEVCWRL